MTEAPWVAVDRYFTDLLVPFDESLDAALRATADAGLPPHSVLPTEGSLLHLLARIQGARTILEIGTLGGYSTIWLARALPPDGRLITLESDPAHARIARANIARAGLAGVVDLRLGPALESLAQLAAEGRGPFDLFFLDADKEHNPEYLAWALRLSRRGSLIVADNVVRGGAVVDRALGDPGIRGIRRFVEILGAEPRVTATAIQTVSRKGHDGMVIALVTGEL